MAIARWRPASDLASLHSTMDRLFSDVFGDSFARMGGEERGLATFHLPVDIQENEDGYVIKAPVPGFNPEDVEITFSDGVLTINATHREEKEEPPKIGCTSVHRLVIWHIRLVPITLRARHRGQARWHTRTPQAAV